MEKILGSFDVSGAPIGFYIEGFHTDIPGNAIEISRADWEAFINEPGAWLWDAAKQERVAVVETLDALKAAASSTVNATRDALIAGGYHHPFGGTIGTRILDQRDARDETAWLVVDRRASQLPADTPFPLRDARNDTFVTTAGGAVNAMGAMADWRLAVSLHSWQLKDAVEAAQSVKDLNKIDLSAGWPA